MCLYKYYTGVNTYTVCPLTLFVYVSVYAVQIEFMSNKEFKALTIIRTTDVVKVSQDVGDTHCTYMNANLMPKERK